MSDADQPPAAPALAVGLARALALLGGAVVLAMACVTVVSVSGRALSGVGFTPVPGDFELVELGCAVAVFCFLPWCQVTRAHVRVDLIGPFVPQAVYRWLGWLGDLILTGVLGLLLVRLWLGFGERFPHGGTGLRDMLGFGPPPFFAETTYELQIPLWIPYGVAVIGLAMAFAVSLSMLLYSARPGARGSSAPL